MENIEEFIKEFESDESVSAGKPGLILLALPVFFIVWILKADDPFGFRLAYSALFTIVTIVLTLIAFVWIPDEQWRKIKRAKRFKDSEKLIAKCSSIIKKIKNNSRQDREVIENVSRAMTTIESLVYDLKLKSKYQGIVEDNLVPGLIDCLVQLYQWQQDQAGADTLSASDKEELFVLLTQKDDLFQTWKTSSKDQVLYLTSKFRSQNQMQSAGINTTSKGEK